MQNFKIKRKLPGVLDQLYAEKVKASLFFWYKEETYALVTKDDIEYVFE